MNVLLINYEYPPIGGGAGNATKFIARAFAKLGHRTRVMTAAYGVNAGVQDDCGVTVHRLYARRGHPDRASALEMLAFVAVALRSARRIAEDAKTEAVIVFFALPCGPIALQLHRKLGLPYVVSLRGGDVPGLVPEIAWQHRLLAPIRRRVLRSAKAIVANDAGLARLSAGADPFPVTVIPNGVDTTFFSPRTGPGPKIGPTTILFVGRFHRQKNLRFLMEQIARLHEAAPRDWRLSMVGAGGERRELEKCARRLNLMDMIAWHGWQEKDGLLDLYRQADVVVNPSLYEGLPNVILEAMACGLPVVASDIPGNNALVDPGQTGFLFPLGDGNALRAALQGLRDQPELAKTLGRNGRRRVEEAFSWEHVAKRYLELFAV